MKKLPLIARIMIWLVIGISLGVICQTSNIEWPIAIMATFRQLFGTFLSFVIPLIIIGLIVPGIVLSWERIWKRIVINDRTCLSFND